MVPIRRTMTNVAGQPATREEGISRRLCLGPIETPQLRELFSRLPAEELPKRLIHYPMGRFGIVEELAGTVAYLASDDAGFVTAAAFPIEGGITGAFTVPS